MDKKTWHDLGPVEQFKKAPLTEVNAGRTKLAISWQNEQLGAISGICNHAGGPLGQGTLDAEYVVCPWHHWKFHCRTGRGEPGYEEDAVPSHALKVEGGHLYVQFEPQTPRRKKPHPPHPLERPIKREPGPIRVVGLSTTAMDRDYPRYSTSEALLQVALDHAASELACATRLIRLDQLRFRHCEGYYSKSARACTWPCSITQMDPEDRMEQVYEALVHWADVVLLATPIRWGASGSLYYKMVERLNCVQNQITIKDNVLIRNKSLDSSSWAGRTTCKTWPGTCSDFSRNSVSSFRSSRISRIRAAGRRRTWSATSCMCSKARSCAAARAS